MCKLEQQERNIIYYINKKTERFNVDNISRTKAYQTFYQFFPEIKWAFLASIVSRNAGWNMTDLQTPIFINLLSDRIRKQLFSTYERANWLIFSDAYPQLLIYQLSVKERRPLFQLLDYFSVSVFMKKEWLKFWYHNNQDRLLTALIINERNIIQSPVTNHPFYKKHVFLNWPYLIQNLIHFNAVILPGNNGYCYAINVDDFTDTSSRISLGKKLAKALFHPDIYSNIYKFAIKTEHTGSRKDYERNISFINKTPGSPILRAVYPIIQHQDHYRKDWFKKTGTKSKWWDEIEIDLKDNNWNSLCLKRNFLKTFYHIINITQKN